MGTELRKGDRVKVRFDGANSADVEAGDIGTIVDRDSSTQVPAVFRVWMEKPRSPGIDADSGYHWLLSASSLQKVVPEPKPGDRVRVTYEATWHSMSTVDFRGGYCIDNYGLLPVPSAATVEVLAPAPKPVYVNHDAIEPEVGDVAILVGASFPRLYTDARGWVGSVSGGHAPFQDKDEIRLVFRGGKQVAQ